MRSIAVVGSGSLARSLCYSLSTTITSPAAVTILARSAGHVDEIAYLANTRAAVSGMAVRFAGCQVDPTRQHDMAALLASVRPTILVNCASLQSPWEGRRAPSRWTELLTRCGFGLGLPLHAMLAERLAAAVLASDTSTLFINASYPDAVNPLLDGLGLPIFCGIGNIGTLAASLRGALSLSLQDDLSLLAHHVHLHEPADPADELKAWLDGQPVAGVGAHLVSQRSCDRMELNFATGHAAAVLLSALLDGGPVRANVPGPLGLPGGYPVRIHGSRIELDFVDGMTLPGVLVWQSRWAAQDGVTVAPGGSVRIESRGREALQAHIGDLPTCLDPAEVLDLGSRLLRLRDTLRGIPAAGERMSPSASTGGSPR